MDWITGMQNAVDYIEEHLTEEIDYEAAAAQMLSSSYHFQRIFSILCGFTVGEYVRNRRLTLAGAELAAGNGKVLDIALKYGYESPDGFAKAFRRFHGINPSAARTDGSRLKSFSRLVIKISMEGGRLMDYRIEEKQKMILTGYKRRFHGAPYGKERMEQEEQLFVTTRGKQWFLIGAAKEPGNEYCVITNVTDEGYDFYYCTKLDAWGRDNLYNHDVTGVDFVEGLKLENIEIPQATYVIFETKDAKKPTRDYEKMLNERIRILTEWLPEMGFQLAEGPELAVYHWRSRKERNIQIWLPIKRTDKGGGHLD